MTNRRLLLMRHAKSDWADESLSDHDRPLNVRGRDAAPRMADWIRHLGDLPDRILCSSSVRTRQTMQFLLDTWQVEIPVTVTESLYLAPPKVIVDVIEEEGIDAQTLLVIAHNPGTASLVSGLAGRFLDMPTAAVAVFDVPMPGSQAAMQGVSQEWRSFGASEDVKLIDFAKPKALP